MVDGYGLRRRRRRCVDVDAFTTMAFLWGWVEGVGRNVLG